jgi:hypothetical protein
MVILGVDLARLLLRAQLDCPPSGCRGDIVPQSAGHHPPWVADSALMTIRKLTVLR